MTNAHQAPILDGMRILRVLGVQNDKRILRSSQPHNAYIVNARSRPIYGNPIRIVLSLRNAHKHTCISTNNDATIEVEKKGRIDRRFLNISIFRDLGRGGDRFPQLF